MQREEEKRRQLKRQQELLKLARQHYHRRLLLQRGLVPWRRLIQLRQANMKVTPVFLSSPDSNIQSVCSQALQLNAIRTQQLVVFILALTLETY